VHQLKKVMWNFVLNLLLQTSPWFFARRKPNHLFGLFSGLSRSIIIGRKKKKLKFCIWLAI